MRIARSTTITNTLRFMRASFPLRATIGLGSRRGSTSITLSTFPGFITSPLGSIPETHPLVHASLLVRIPRISSPPFYVLKIGGSYSLTLSLPPSLKAFLGPLFSVFAPASQEALRAQEFSTSQDLAGVDSASIVRWLSQASPSGLQWCSPPPPSWRSLASAGRGRSATAPPNPALRSDGSSPSIPPRVSQAGLSRRRV